MTTKETLIQDLKDKKARIAILGLGYVGLPLAVVFGEAGFNVTGIDPDSRKVDLLTPNSSISIFSESSFSPGDTLPDRIALRIWLMIIWVALLLETALNIFYDQFKRWLDAQDKSRRSIRFLFLNILESRDDSCFVLPRSFLF